MGCAMPENWPSTQTTARGHRALWRAHAGKDVPRLSGAFICGSGITPCACGVVAEFLCDYPLGEGRTCSTPLCEECRIKPYGEIRDMDVCPIHALQLRAAEAS